jgi:hypothetical protein
MPKRKRGYMEEGGDRALLKRKHDVEENITQGRKLLHRALKASKGFERQRLGKRLTNARTQGNDSDIQRIGKEIEALKCLDLGKVGEAHLRKTLLKIKAFADSELLPDEIRGDVEKPDMGEEELKAWNNVLSGMFNMKAVKEAMSHIVGGMYVVLDVPAPIEKQNGKGTNEPEKEISKDVLRPSESGESTNLDVEHDMGVQSDESPWEGFDSEDEQNPNTQSEEDGLNIYSEEDLDEEELSRYDDLLGGSSDEESFDEERYKANRSPSHLTRLSISLSPTPSSASESQSASWPPSKAAKAVKSKSAPAKVGGSTFLPTLMGGYYEGSNSSASDIDEGVMQDKPVRKNRPGQIARQAIWEKKFGQRANHIQKGLGPVAERGEKRVAWDPKRGATDGSSRGRFGNRKGGKDYGQERGGGERRTTGEKSTAIGERKRGMGKKDDAGVLHPSWQAAKRAKEMKKTAAFQGKKVVFD